MAPMTSAPPAAGNRPADHTRPARTTYRSVFAAAPFRVLFAALATYVLGFEFEILGLSVLVFTQTRSALLTALAFSMGFAPQVVGGALFSSLADRLPRRLVISAGLLVRAGPGLVIGLRPSLPVPVMLALVAVAALASPVLFAALSGLLPDVLDGDRYVLGRSVFNLTSSGTQIVGLGVGGAVLAAVPARWLLLAAGGSLLVAAVITHLGLRPAPAGNARAAGGLRGGMVRATLAGHAELLRDRTVRGLLLAQWLPAWFVTGAESLIVPYTGSLGRPAPPARCSPRCQPGCCSGSCSSAGSAPRACARGWRSRSSRRWACPCWRCRSARRRSWPAWPCSCADPASPTSSASSGPSSPACRNNGAARVSASTRPARWAARA